MMQGLLGVRRGAVRNKSQGSSHRRKPCFCGPQYDSPGQRRRHPPPELDGAAARCAARYEKAAIDAPLQTERRNLVRHCAKGFRPALLWMAARPAGQWAGDGWRSPVIFNSRLGGGALRPIGWYAQPWGQHLLPNFPST